MKSVKSVTTRAVCRSQQQAKKVADPAIEKLDNFRFVLEPILREASKSTACMFRLSDNERKSIESVANNAALLSRLLSVFRNRYKDNDYGMLWDIDLVHDVQEKVTMYLVVCDRIPDLVLPVSEPTLEPVQEASAE